MTEKALFQDALAKPAAERAAFLDAACAGQPKLREGVEALLAAHEAAGSFLDKPAVDLGHTVDSQPGRPPLDLTGDFTPQPHEARPHPDGTDWLTDAGHSVLHALSEKVADVPRVVLRDEAGADAPIALSQSAEMPAGKSDSRYQLQGEIARGGMGAILKGRDTDLGRDLAIKVLLDAHKDKPEVVQRFIEEAQIGGQLQHPGIVPVYELGQFADERPFFSMKLVKGQTLSSLLAERKQPGEDRPRFLGIFQQICQTLAYAHSRGVIHRDLKPANIMVGAFGEVQVMDWGLAKVLAVGGVADEKKAYEKQQDVSVIRTVRQDGDSASPFFGSQTLAGSVLGTPAYMAPEQALGEVDRLDERADVFGLGAILCEVLTGKPPYTGRDSTEVLRLATRGKLEGCHARLQGCGADAELVELARDCVASEPEERPRHAGVVAERITAYLASVESRLRAVEIERAAEAARAAEALHTVAETEAKARAERRARRWQVGVAVGVVVLTTVAGIAAVWTAMYQSRLKEDALVAQQKANTAREAETKQRQRAEAEKTRAEAEKTRADITLADMQTSRGLLAGERGAPAEAVLWFAAASEQAATAGDSQRQEHNRLRARNWMRQATLPVAVMSLKGYAAQLDFQPGGDLLLVRSSDRHHVFLWSWREGKLLSWADKLAGVNAACFSPDGTSLAVGFLSGEVQIRSVADGRLAGKMRHRGQIKALAFSPDGKSLALGSNSVRVWDVERKAFLDAVWNHPQPVNALLFNRQGNRLITACDDKQVRVFAVAEKPERTEPLYAPLVHQPHAVSPPALIDGDRTLVTVSGNKELARWDMATGKPVSERIPTKAWGLQKVGASPDGKWFVTGGYYGPQVHAADGQQPVLQLGHTNLVRNFVFSQDNTILLTASWDRTARLWSLPDGRPVGGPLAHTYGVHQCALSDDARLVATAQEDGLIRVWRRPTDALVIGWRPFWGQRPRLSFDGKLVAPGLWHEEPAGYKPQGMILFQVVAAADGKAAGAQIPLLPPGLLVDSCVCGDNRTVAAVFRTDPAIFRAARGAKDHFRAWDIATGRPLFDPVALPGMPLSVAARPNSDELAVLCTTGDLLVLDSHTGKTRFQTRHQGWVWHTWRSPRVQYTPDGKTLVSLGAGPNTTVNVFDADTRQLRFAPLHPVLKGGARCRGFAVSADSRLLATIVNGKNAAQVWDLATGRPLSQPLLHPGQWFGLYSVCFSPDGRRLLTGTNDGRVRYWDWRAGKLACPPMGLDDEVFDVAITPDGRFALAAVRGAPRRLHIWELATGKPIAPPVQPGNSAAPLPSSHTVAITPDGRRALVNFSPRDLAVVDLEALLSPSAAPVADLALLAELATAQSIEAGDLNGLTTDQWQQRWNLLRERNPQLVRSAVTETKSAVAARNRLVQVAAGAFVRGREFARRGEWAKAAKEALAVVAAHPEDRMLWSKAAPLLILAGDIPGYRRLCGGMIEQFRDTTKAEEADSVCKMCLLLPNSADRSQLPSKILREAAEQDTTEPGYRRWFFACLALMAYRDGQFEQAADYSQKSLAINQKRGPDGALASLVLAMARHQLKQPNPAREALAEGTALVPYDLATLGSPEFHGSLPVSLGTVGSDWLMAEIIRREAALLIRKDASRPLDAAALRNRGLELYKQGKLDEALTALRKANELEDRHAQTHMMVGVILARQAKPDEAIRELRRAIEIAPDYPPALLNLGMILLDQGKLDEAITLLDKAVQLQKTQLGPDHVQTLFTMSTLAAAYVLAHKPDLALPLLEITLKMQRAKLGTESPQLAGVLALMGDALLQTKSFAKAEAILRECLAIRTKASPEDWKTFNAKVLLGGALLGQKKYADAEPLLRAGYEGMQKHEKEIPPQGKVRLSEAVERLVRLYEATGKTDEAAKWRKELETIQAARKTSGKEP